MSEIEHTEAGSVQLDEKVLKEIVFNAVNQVKGVTLARRRLTTKLVHFIFGIKYPGVSLKVKNGVVVVNIKIFVRYGLNMPNVAHQVQDAAKAALEKTTQVDVQDVNVNILGIDREGKI